MNIRNLISISLTLQQGYFLSPARSSQAEQKTILLLVPPSQNSLQQTIKLLSRKMKIFSLIPTLPKVRFENYLDQFIEKSKQPTSSIRVKKLGALLEKIIKKVGQKTVKRKLEISNACLRGWITGRRAIPLLSLKKLVEMGFRSDLREFVWNRIFKKIEYYTLAGSPHHVKLPLFVTPRLFYFVGYLYGDGCLSDTQKRSYENGGLLYEIKIADFSLSQVEGIGKLFDHIFNVQPKIGKERIEKGEQTYYIDPKCKVVHNFLNQIFRMPVGEKKHKLKIPPIVFQAPRKLRVWFIAGFFDADGSIFRNHDSKRQKYTINLKQASLQILKDIQYLLDQDFEIILQGPYEEPEGAWSISSGKQSTVKKFCKKLPLTHSDKRKQARKMVY